MREERALLAEQADAPELRGNVDAVAGQEAAAQPHLAVVGGLQPGDDAHECRLAAAAGPQQGHGPATLDGEVGTPQRVGSGKGLAGCGDLQIPERSEVTAVVPAVAGMAVRATGTEAARHPPARGTVRHLEGIRHA